MKYLRLYSILTIGAFSGGTLFGDQVSPPVVSENPLPDQDPEEAKAEEALAAHKIDEKTNDEDIDASEQDARTDMFMRGAFTVLSALLFLAGYVSVKTHQGKRV